MRRRNRAIAIFAIAAAGVLAAPGFAAAPAKPEAPAASNAGPSILPTPKRAAAVATAVGRTERAQQRRRRERRQGPVFPLVGKPDFGTAENAYGAARSGHMHSGQDIFAPTGTPLVAVTDAVVADAGTDGGQGNYVHLYEAEENRTFIYMHMVAPPKVQTGDAVKAGDQLGGVGCSGSCWGEHLHFEVREGKGWGGTPQDPMPFLQSAQK